MSESTFYECCQNFGTHTHACNVKAIRKSAAGVPAETPRPAGYWTFSSATAHHDEEFPAHDFQVRFPASLKEHPHCSRCHVPQGSSEATWLDGRCTLRTFLTIPAEVVERAALGVPPAATPPPDPHTTEWYERRAAEEDGKEVAAGSESVFAAALHHVWRPIETAPRHGYFFVCWDNGASSLVRFQYGWENWPSIEKYVATVNRVQGWWIPTSASPVAPPAAKETPAKPIRAHVEGCPKTLSVPVDLCDCGGRNFLPDAAAQGWTPPRYVMQIAVNGLWVARKKHDHGEWVKWSDIAHLFPATKEKP